MNRGEATLADIFISYARADREQVEKLAAALEGEGYSVWWDRHIASGAEFSSDIERELNAAKAVIVCWSEEGVKSRWVKDEATIAARADKLKTITLDGTEPPIGYMQYHALDFAGWNGAKNHPAFQQLLNDARTHFAKLPDANEASTENGIADADAADLNKPMKLTPPVGKQKASPLADPKIIGAVLAFIAVAVIAIFVLTRGGGEPNGARTKTAEAVVDRSKSIAVLPFDDFSADDNEWFADGLTEEILNSLARTPDLLVASRTSSFAYKDTEEEIPAIARRLGVEHVLEGSVRRAGDRLRVTAQLIRASDGFHLWSENFDRDADDVIAIQEEIAIAIAKALKTAMDPKALEEMLSAGTRSVDAYEAYLEGLALRSESSASGENLRERADQAFERARAIDPISLLRISKRLAPGC